MNYLAPRQSYLLLDRLDTCYASFELDKHRMGPDSNRSRDCNACRRVPPNDCIVSAYPRRMSRASSKNMTAVLGNGPVVRMRLCDRGEVPVVLRSQGRIFASRYIDAWHVSSIQTSFDDQNGRVSQALAQTCAQGNAGCSATYDDLPRRYDQYKS